MAYKKFCKAALIPLFLMATAPIISACQTVPVAPSPEEEAAVLTVTGSATYRERMAAPKGSVLKVELSDTSRADAPAISLADWSDSLDDGGVPKKFTLRVNDTLDPRGTYTLRATVTGADGALLWTTDTVHPVTTLAGNVTTEELVMVKVQPAPAPAMPEVSGIDYFVTSIDGVPTTGKRRITLNFGKDGRAGGFGGCNTYGGSYTQTGEKIAFGLMVSTMMACLDERVSLQEAGLHGALKGTATLSAGEKETLILTGENGTKIGLTPSALKPLAGTNWLVETMGGTAIIAGHEPQIAFDAEGRISGTTGCNRFFGGYTQDGSTLNFSGVGMTKMACLDDGVMEQESSFTAILNGKTEGSLDGFDNLVIKGEDGISFTARPLPEDVTEGDPAVLGGGTWQVEDLNRGGVIDNTVMTLTFTEDGKVSGSTGCNNITGSYTATGTTLTFSPLAMTRRACLAPALANQETTFSSALQGEMAWRIAADGALELTREGGHRILLRH